MAHFVPFGDGYLNLDRIDRVTMLGDRRDGEQVVVAERHGMTNTILGRAASRDDALAFIKDLLGDAIHEHQ